MKDVVRELDVNETAFTLLLLAMLFALSGSFWLGVRLGRDESLPAATATGQGASSSPAAAPASTRPVSTATAPLTSAPVAKPSPQPAGRRFLGPPPLPSPAPVDGRPGVSLRGGMRAVALEIAVWDSMEPALAERLRLLGLGYPAYMATLPDSEGRPRFRVRVGDYATSQEAELVRARLARREGVKASIVE